MMRSRSFMSGLGVGLIIGAALLQLMIIGEGQASLVNTQSDAILTKEQLEEKAEALDLKVVELSEQLLTEEEWKQLKLEESSNLQGKGIETPNQGEPAATPVEPSAPIEPKGKNTTSDTQSPKEPIVEPTNTEIIKYKIEKGKSLTDVAVGLEKVGVISNRDQFIKEASKQKINTKILEGHYTFTKGESYESIISKIRIESSR
ncbi:hypothetical protein ACP8HI_05725 [Paenibacillus sp. FA6]|uniref:hypothetical protein n=1 Tax=Paenibacillus sp. FA6 TaxID=3413029 RepID=UPI003F65F760